MTVESVLRRVPAVLAAVALVAGTAGCYTMARVPAGYVNAQKPAEIFVRDAEGAIYSLSNPAIVHDSLVGHDGDEQISVNLREVDAMVVRVKSPTKTAGAIGTSAAVLGLVTFGVVKATTTGDCKRIANRNNRCVYDITEGCKYGACDASEGS